MFWKKTKIQERVGEFISKIFSPLSVLIKFVWLFSKKFFEYFKSHKEFVIAFTYGVGLFLQAAFLYFAFWVEGLPYISITFSILFLVILLFFAFLWIPFIAILILSATLFAFVGLWPVVLLLVLLLLLIRCIFPKFNVSKFKVLEEKMDLLYVGYTLVLVLLMFAGFVIQFTSSKPVELTTDKGGKYGDLLFYNKDHYFLSSCGEKIVVPSNEVKEVRFVCAGNKCSKEKLAAENQKYSFYCQNKDK